MKKHTAYILPFIPFVCFIIGYSVSNLLVGPTSHQTPNLIGLSLQDAIKITSQNHVTLQLMTEKECPSVQPGTILTQKPKAGRLMKPQQTILVTIAKQKPQQTCPNFLLTKKDHIVKTAQKLGYKIKQYYHTHELPADICIGQSPKSNDQLIDKKMIAYISKEKPNLFIMPNFVGQSIITVEQLLKNQGIAYSIVRNQPEQTKQQDAALLITDQKPRAGSFIQKQEQLKFHFEV